MRAVVQERYGPPEVLELRDVPPPAMADDEVLVRVRAASVNPLDWHMLRGEPFLVRLLMGLRRPKIPTRGVDVAGTVEKVGAAVTGFAPGDDVFGVADGALAELASADHTQLARKPARLSFEEAAALPIAGCTALQALRDHAGLEAGYRVLVIGAGGGVGTFAVQLAHAFGAEVTGVCGAGKAELVRSLGAVRTVDYASGDFTASGERYDVVLQLAGDYPVSKLRRILTPNGTLVLAGSGAGREQSGGGVLGPLARMTRARLVSRRAGRRVTSFLARVRDGDLRTLAAYVEDGRLTSIVDRTYRLAEAADALRHLEAGHARGKTVIAISRDEA